MISPIDFNAIERENNSKHWHLFYRKKAHDKSFCIMETFKNFKRFRNLFRPRDNNIYYDQVI